MNADVVERVTVFGALAALGLGAFAAGLPAFKAALLCVLVRRQLDF